MNWSIAAKPVFDCTAPQDTKSDGEGLFKIDDAEAGTRLMPIFAVGYRYRQAPRKEGPPD